MALTVYLLHYPCYCFPMYMEEISTPPTNHCRYQPCYVHSCTGGIICFSLFPISISFPYIIYIPTLAKHWGLAFSLNWDSNEETHWNTIVDDNSELQLYNCELQLWKAFQSILGLGQSNPKEFIGCFYGTMGSQIFQKMSVCWYILEFLVKLGLLTSL